MPIRDLKGQRFDRLLVIERAPNKNGRNVIWKCACDCGMVKDIAGIAMTSGATQSCGCLMKERARKRFTTHGQWGSATYTTWDTVVQRCTNPKSTKWEFYGGRGIGVCDRWLKFKNFLADMGERPDGMTLDRFPNMNGDYEPSNCRWATQEQQHNNTRSNHWIEYRGVRFTISQLARKVGLHPAVLGGRIRNGWSIERATTTACIPR